MSHRALAKAPRLRVLHVWNTCGVGSLITRITPNCKSRVITRKINGTGDFPDYHDATVIRGPAFVFKLFVYLQLKLFKPHVVHVHALIDYLQFVRKHSTGFLIFHGHGTMLRKHSGTINADLKLVSTPDLLQIIPDAIVCPNPVAAMFHPGNMQKRTALFVRNACCDRLLMAVDYAKTNNLKLRVIDLIDKKAIPYSMMPAIIRKHEYFLEFKGFPYPVLSKIAMEALASGVSVIHEDNFRLIKPDSLDFKRIDQKFVDIYEEIRKCFHD